MNYLAHLFVSPREPFALAGALAGDVLHGQLDEAWPLGVRQGVRLHRAIDAFSDQHPALRSSRGRLSRFRHHARIIVDVFYDHFLAAGFEEWSGGESLREYAAEVYRHLRDVREELPPRLAEFNDRMIEHGWLSSYGEIESVERALWFLSRRLKHPRELASSVRELRGDYAGFEADFRWFFPELLAFVAQHRASAT